MLFHTCSYEWFLVLLGYCTDKLQTCQLMYIFIHDRVNDCHYHDIIMYTIKCVDMMGVQ